jgi:hypothetical protein
MNIVYRDGLSKDIYTPDKIENGYSKMLRMQGAQ